MQFVITLDGTETAKHVERAAQALLKAGGSKATLCFVDLAVLDKLGGSDVSIGYAAAKEGTQAHEAAEAILVEHADEIDLTEAMALLGGAAPLAPAAPSSTIPATPPASAPAAPPATSAAIAPAGSVQVELDARGFPWDERIHSSAKSKVADGSWKVKRGVQDHLVASIETDYRAHGYGTAQAPAAPVAAPPAPAPAPTPAPAAPPAPAAAAPVPPVNGGEEFRAFVKLLTGAMTAQKISQQQLALATQQVGLGAFGELQGRPDLIPQVRQILGL